MAKRYLIISIFVLLSTQLKAQQFGLYNTRTLFDAFENPAQKAFVLDSSRQYASNFLLPYFGLNAASKGESKYTLSRIIHDGVYSSRDIPIGNNNRNKFYESSNIYLATFRIFKSYKYHKELGFSWQIQTDAYADYTNETLVAFDDYNRFSQSQDNLFNGNGFGQSYHQFSMTYRENYDKRLSFGVKLSLLSGITYNQAKVTDSYLDINTARNELNIGVTGTYRASFLYGDELSRKTLMPNFKNPGLSVGFGTTYNAKSGIFIMASVKDLGFIKWNKTSHDIYINNVVTVDRNSAINDDLSYQFEDIVVDADRQKSFYSLTNAKADFLISSKKYGMYTPNLIVSKNLFYNGGNAAFVNTFKFNELSGSLTPAYNFNGFGMVGLQGMYQTPNFEFFMGTDNLFKSASVRQKATVNSGYTGASFYMGLGIKFGYTVEHPQNSSYMPGVGDDANERSFFSRIFGGRRR